MNIFGWYDSRDLDPNLTLANYTEDQAMSDVRRFAADFNALAARVESDLVAATDDVVQSNFGLGIGGEMQPFNEGGDTEATRTPLAWSTGYPLYGYRSRKLYTEQYLAGVTLEKLEKDIIQAGVENWETRRKMVLRALLRKANYTFDDGTADSAEWPKTGFGTLTVRRLANGDSASGEVWVNGSAVQIGTLNHYFGTNNATFAQTHLETAYAKLKVVGLTQDVVIRINSAQETLVRGFTDFVAGANPRLVDPQAVYAVIQSPQAIGRIEGDAISAEIIVEPYMPAGYFFAYDRAAAKPVKIRVHPLAQWRGFRLVQDETRGVYGEQSFRNKLWEFIAGAGVRNRVNGVAGQIVASATYTDPTI